MRGVIDVFVGVEEVVSAAGASSVPPEAEPPASSLRGTGFSEVDGATVVVVVAVIIVVVVAAEGPNTSSAPPEVEPPTSSTRECALCGTST